eukprot:6199867-Pleurochrysis_carterae.AAC.10
MLNFCEDNGLVCLQKSERLDLPGSQQDWESMKPALNCRATQTRVSCLEPVCDGSDRVAARSVGGARASVLDFGA